MPCANIWLRVFLSNLVDLNLFSCLISLTRTQLLCQTQQTQRLLLCSWSQRRSFSLFLSSVAPAEGLSYVAFIISRKFSSSPSFGVYIVKGRWVFSNAFSVSLGMIIGFLSFVLLIWYIELIFLGRTPHSGINPTWSWCMMLCCWIFLHQCVLKYWSAVFL